MHDLRKRSVLIALIGIFVLSCSGMQRLPLKIGGVQGQVDSLTHIANPISGTAAPEVSATLQAGENPLPAGNAGACNATSYLTVTSQITKQETNQYGTRICEYTLKVVNIHADTAVWFYIYQHDRDGYARTEKGHWMGNVLVAPGTDGSWPASIYLYDDKDADGPVMSIPEKIAGVYDIPECARAKQDASFFEAIAVPVEPVCPME